MPMIRMIPTQRTITVSDFSIDVHIMGPGYGEGIIVVIGKKIILGVDSCSSLINSTLGEDCYIEGIIRTIHDEPFIIWTLTHFHHDHLVGLAWILRRFAYNIKLVIIPDSYTSKDIAENVRRHARLDTKSDAMYFASGGEYEELIGACSISPINERICKASPHYRALDAEIRTRRGVTRRLAIDVIGASAGDLTALTAKQIQKAMSKVSRQDRAAANFGSYIVLLSVGDFRAALLGDALAKRTQELPWLETLGNGGASLVKVAHHGALDGTTPKLLQQLAGHRERIAVVTPFRTQGLPRSDVLRLFQDSGFDVKISGRNDRDKRDIRQAIELEFGLDSPLTVESAVSPEQALVLSKFNCR